jgi:hypothetical protein
VLRFNLKNKTMTKTTNIKIIQNKTAEVKKFLSGKPVTNKKNQACDAWIYCDIVNDPKGCSKLWKECFNSK